ncbi:MAG: hypothetical protein QW303_07405 [Nitrososphaerota archaeon]
MLLDPSHIGGTVKNVLEIAKEGMSYKYRGIGFDGLFIEVHPKEEKPLTDANQQLSWEQLDSLISQLKLEKLW